MLKGTVWERVVMVIARKPSEYSGGNRVWVWMVLESDGNICIFLEFLLRITHAANADESLIAGLAFHESGMTQTKRAWARIIPRKSDVTGTSRKIPARVLCAVVPIFLW